MAAALIMTLGACSMPLEGAGVKPAAPGKPVLKAGSSGISIIWDEVALAKLYQVYCAMNPEPPSYAAFSTTETSADIREFQNNTTYYVWIRAENERGLSPFSEAADITTTLRPGEPELTYKDGGIIVSWKPVPVADSYNVYYAADPAPPKTPQKPNITGTSVTITGVTLGAAYYVWVEGVNSGGTALSGAKSIELYLTAPEPVLTAGDGSITVNWEPVPLAGSYNVYYAEDSTAPETPYQSTITGTSITITGLANESTYYVWVEAVNSGEKKTSGAKSIKLSLAAPVPVLTPKDGGITASWEPVPLANSYNVYCGTDPTPPGTPYRSNITETSVTITGVTLSTTYYVWVEAVNSGGTTMSGAKSVITPALAVPVPVLTPQDGGLTVSWEPVLLANSYNVYYAAASTPPGTPYQSNITGTSLTITGLANGAAYYVWVEAVNSDETAMSGAVSGVPQVVFVLEYTVSSEPEFIQAVAGINASSTPGLYRINLISSITADSISFSPFSSGKTIIIRGDTVLRTIYNAKNADLFTVPSGAALVLENNAGLNGNEKNGWPAYVDGGTLVMKAGSSIEGAKKSGVYVENGVFTMEGGKISGNTAPSSSSSSSSYSYYSSYGGGVYISGGTFTMSGGEISGNTTSYYSYYSSYSYGGGVYISGGTFTMSGGKISGNTASSSYSYGGGVFVSGNSTFTMSGGEISGNTASSSSYSSYSYGGGVFVSDNSTFMMSGGKISGNTASSSSSRGGGVYVFSNSRFTKKGGGTITDTNSAAEGKAVYAESEYVDSGMRRNSAAGPDVDMDSYIIGSNGGWE
jgi:fibronectin type 3 domain-containing protein